MSERLDPRVRPEFAKGPLAKVGWARNQAEAEMMEGLLLEQGIPSLVRRIGRRSTCRTSSPPARATSSCPPRAPRSRASCSAPRSRPEPGPAGEGTPAWVKALAVAVAVAIVALVAAGVFAAVF